MQGFIMIYRTGNTYRGQVNTTNGTDIGNTGDAREGREDVIEECKCIAECEDVQILSILEA
tara:strand:+ start:362 stop:544 length:183 start_codon:yes stop_codon:yes gene_type:complete